jgi:hypothetical protein
MATKKMSWDEAIIQVLTENGGVMHYRDIADAIAEKGLRTQEDMGATPANTVNVILHSDKLKGKVASTGERGKYVLTSILQQNPILAPATPSEDDEDDEGDVRDAMISAFGRFWDRAIFEKNESRLYGINFLAGSKNNNISGVDFSEHPGIYMLHKGYQVIYVGQATHLCERLNYHTTKDLRNRWDNFSWFSIKDISSDNEECKDRLFSDASLLDTLEALLIETLGPERNKKAGNEFIDKEFEQITQAEYYKRLAQGKRKK